MNNLNSELSVEQYKVFQRFLENSCGIVLGEGKHYLVKNRLHEVLCKLNITSFAELTNILQTDSIANQRIKASVVDAMTTNETYWFRDDSQFAELKDKLLPELIKTKSGGVKIWSAACSSGQEPYSISMCVEELIHKGYSGSVQILGTDISASIIQEATQAVYSEMAIMRGLDSSAKAKYFQSVATGGLSLKPDIARRVRFQQFNLLNSFSTLGRFDVIFCRNVLIYFSETVKRDILSRMAGSLNAGGYLFLSSTESMPTEVTELEPIRSSKVRYFKKLPFN